MEQEIGTSFGEVVGAIAGIGALLIYDLDERGVLSRVEFAKRLRKQADQLEADPHSLVTPGRKRLDLAAIRGLADFLEGPPPKGWTPVVIDGGKN